MKPNKQSNGQEKILSEKKRVDFCNKVKVVLIPKCHEYWDAKRNGQPLAESIWWNSSDYEYFRDMENLRKLKPENEENHVSNAPK